MKKAHSVLFGTFIFSLIISLSAQGKSLTSEDCKKFRDPNKDPDNYLKDQSQANQIDRNAVMLKNDGNYGPVSIKFTNQFVADAEKLKGNKSSEFDALIYWRGQPMRFSEFTRRKTEIEKSGDPYCSTFGIEAGKDAQAVTSSTLFPNIAFYSDKDNVAVARNADSLKKNCIDSVNLYFRTLEKDNAGTQQWSLDKGLSCSSTGGKNYISPQDLQNVFGRAINVSGLSKTWNSVISGLNRVNPNAGAWAGKLGEYSGSAAKAVSPYFQSIFSRKPSSAPDDSGLSTAFGK